MDEKRYNDVLTACALVKDIKLLPHGDLTEIGEQVYSISLFLCLLLGRGAERMGWDIMNGVCKDIELLPHGN